ncbi:MAG: DUF1810 domain-containing protein [Acidobacteria bacterium]|nr:DUF1810 domain-containing protein [Acidobacteriota bacterium]
MASTEGKQGKEDQYDLARFLSAQEDVYEQACAELRAGRKRSHWMWFIFPQIRGLGASEMSVRFAISSLEEAREYLAHEVLGRRLREAAGIVAALAGKTAEQVFGYPDDLKFHSSMTLFARVAEKESIFEIVLSEYFSGQMDPETLNRI